MCRRCRCVLLVDALKQVSDDKAKGTAKELEEQDLVAELLLRRRAKEPEEQGHQVQVVSSVRPLGGMKQSRLLVVHWKPVPRARHNLEELRTRIHKVDDLRNEEDEQGLAKVPEYARHRQRHSSEIRVCVPNEHSRRVVVEQQQCRGDCNQGQRDVDREELGVSYADVFHAQLRQHHDLREPHEVEEEHRARDHEGLPGLQPVESGEDVDGVGGILGNSISSSSVDMDSFLTFYFF